MRRLAAASAILLGAGAAVAARTGGPAAAAAAAIVLERPHRAQAVEAAPPGSAWEGCAFVLEGPEGRTASRSVSAVCRGDGPDGAPQVRPLVSGLPGARALATDPLGDGQVRLLVGVAGGVRAFRLAARGEPAVEAGPIVDARLDPASLADRPDLDGDGTRDLLQATWEGLSAWRWTDAGFVPLRAVALPRRAAAAGGEVSVWSPIVLARDEAPAPRWTWPAGWTGERLRVERIELGPHGAGPACPAWIAPGSRVQTAAAAVLDGDPPRLATLIEPAERIALLGERRLLVAPLVCRASGRGEPPAQLLDTPLANYFAGATLLVRDATGDGLADVLAIGISGRLKPDLEVLVWPEERAGGLARRPLRWSRRAESMGGGWSFGRDLDGDGRPDLVRWEGETVWLARGLAPTSGRVPLEAVPSFVTTLPREYPEPALLGPLPARSTRPGEPAWLLFGARRASPEDGTPADALLVVPVPAR